MSVQVYAGGVLAYDDRLPAEKNYTLLSGLISESLNKGGTATIVMPPGHPASDAFPALVVPVEIYKNGRLRWRGRPLPNSSDIYGRRTVTCEGELCFLNDVVSRPYAYSGDPAELFTMVLEAYNAGADPWKRFVVGTISVTGDAMELTSVNPEKVLVTVQKLIQQYGGYILFDSAPDGSRRINWYSQLPYACNQKIRHGYNLTDYNSQSDLTGFATRIVPYGATDADGNRLKINNDGKDYVENADAVAARGVIEMPVIYDDISDPEELKARAEQDVQASSTLPEVLRLSAVDMSRLDLQLDAFQIGQRVEAESDPHGMSGIYDLVSLTEDIVNPTVGQATLTRDAAYIDLAAGTMTGTLNKQQQDSKEEYKKAFSSYLGAVASLTSTILGANGGAVRILDTDGDGLNDTLYIADNPDPELAVKVWRFNYEGWAGSKTGYNGPFIMGATLEDGIIADFITAGTLYGILVKAGAIESEDGKIRIDLGSGERTPVFNTGISTNGLTVRADEAGVSGYVTIEPIKMYSSDGSTYYLPNLLMNRLDGGMMFRVSEVSGLAYTAISSENHKRQTVMQAGDGYRTGVRVGTENGEAWFGEDNGVFMLKCGTVECDKITVNGAKINSTESWETTLSNSGSSTHTCSRPPVAVIVGAQYQGTGLVTGIWTPETSGLENSMYGATGGYTDVWPTTVTISGKTVTVKRGGSASLKYFITAIMQMD